MSEHAAEGHVEPLVAADAEDVGRLLRPQFAEEGFPWKQIAGFIGSLAFTFVALILVVNRVVPVVALIPIILTLAAIQAGWQLGFFMHLRESRGPAWHIGVLVLGGGIGILLVIFSIWIMMFKWGVS